MKLLGHCQKNTNTYFIFNVGVILSQSIVRRYIASNEASLRRHESQVAYATSIQSKWRAYEASKQFALSRQRVILIQSITRMQFAMKYLYIHQMFATEISAAWRRSLAVKSFMRSREAATKITSFYRRIKCLVNYRQVMRGKQLVLFECARPLGLLISHFFALFRCDHLSEYCQAQKSKERTKRGSS